MTSVILLLLGNGKFSVYRPGLGNTTGSSCRRSKMPSRIQRLKWRSYLVNENLVVNTGGKLFNLPSEVVPRFFREKHIVF